MLETGVISCIYIYIRHVKSQLNCVPIWQMQSSNDRRRRMKRRIQRRHIGWVFWGVTHKWCKISYAKSTNSYMYMIEGTISLSFCENRCQCVCVCVFTTNPSSNSNISADMCYVSEKSVRPIIVTRCYAILCYMILWALRALYRYIYDKLYGLWLKGRRFPNTEKGT